MWDMSFDNDSQIEYECKNEDEEELAKDGASDRLICE